MGLVGEKGRERRAWVGLAGSGVEENVLEESIAPDYRSRRWDGGADVPAGAL